MHAYSIMAWWLGGHLHESMRATCGHAYLEYLLESLCMLRAEFQQLDAKLAAQLADALKKGPLKGKQR